jgi:predicted 2-oxoglutarate/Fe(II)-dependent dioxygenase YbiX
MYFVAVSTINRLTNEWLKKWTHDNYGMPMNTKHLIPKEDRQSVGAVKLAPNVLIINGFLDPSHCRQLIAQSELIGYRQADVALPQSRQVLSNIRNNDRVNRTDEVLATTLWQKLHSFELPPIEGKKATGLSPQFRVYRYRHGQKFNMHKDGRQQINDQTTLCTLLVYLNEDLSGGATAFRQDNIVVAPQTGKALIFEHQLWHSGQAVSSGSKYVLRTGIIYG